MKYRKPLEKDIQASILQLLQRHPAVAWAHRMNTGATVVDAPNSKRRFIRYGFPGCSDILGMLKGGRFLAIEVKRPGEEATDLQQAFLDSVNEAGGLGFVAWDIEDVAQALHAFVLN